MKKSFSILVSLLVLALSTVALAVTEPPFWVTSGWGHAFPSPAEQHVDMGGFLFGTSSESQTSNLAQYASCSTFGQISFASAVSCTYGG